MNKKRWIALMVAMVMALTLMPMGAFGLEAAAYEVAYHSVEEMTTSSPTDDSTTDEATENAEESATEENASNEYEAEEEAPSYENEENATEEKPSYEYEEDGTEEESSDNEEDEEDKLDLNNISGGGALEAPVFFTFYPEELVVQSHELFSASVEELNAILLQGVSVVDEFGSQLEVAVQNDGGLVAYIAAPDAFEYDIYLDIANWQIVYAVEVNGVDVKSETRNLRVEFAQIMALSNVQVSTFAELQAALAGASDGDVIEITAMITLPVNTNETISFNGGNITLIVTGEHRHFNVQAGRTLSLGTGVTLQGHRPGNSTEWTVDVNAPAWPVGGGVSVNGGGIFILDGGVITGVNAGGAVLVNPGSFYLNSGEISHNQMRGADIRGATSTFTMSGGTIAHNGGGLLLTNSVPSATMSSGSIVSNEVTGTGAGVNVANNSHFTISGDALISGNVAQGGGGGVIVVQVGSSFTMDGGLITSNIAQHGGGILTSGGSVVMNNGLIAYNEARIAGGGIQMGSSAGTAHAVQINGGVIRDNEAPRGGGVNIADGGVGGANLNVGSGATITNNIATRDNASGHDVSVDNSDANSITLSPDASVGDIRQVSPGGGTMTTPGGEVDVPAGTIVVTPGRGGADTIDIYAPGEADPITVPPGSTVLPNPDTNTGGAIVISPDGDIYEVPSGGTLDSDGTVRDADNSPMFVVRFFNYNAVFIQTSSVLSGSTQPLQQQTPPA